MDLRTTWTHNTQRRDDFLFWTTRDLSNTGSLASHAHILRELAGFLDRDEIRWLYTQLLESRRDPLDWRDEFLALFPQFTVQDLPPASLEEEVVFREDERRQTEWLAKYDQQRSQVDPGDPIPF